MTAADDGAEPLRLAAELAFALLRFEQGAAHPSRFARPSDRGEVGVDAFVFIPSWREVARDAVVPFLTSLPSPAALVPSTMRGHVALLLLDELAGDRRRWMQKTIDNFGAGLDHAAGQLALDEASPIVLEFDDEVHVFPLAVLRLCMQRFPVQVAWSVGSLEHDRRATARLMLMRSDGTHSWGGSCPVHPRDA